MGRDGCPEKWCGDASLWPRHSQEGHVSPVSTGILPLFTMFYVCIGALPQTAARLGLVSLLSSEQTNTDSLACCVSLGAPGQAGGMLPWTMACSQP